MEQHPLLKRVRFEVIPPGYPGSPFTPGEIITLTPGAKRDHDFVSEKGKHLYYYELLKYPALFSELKWHEKRELSEMPEYIHIPKDMRFIDAGVYKVTWVIRGHRKLMSFCVDNVAHPASIAEPATLADYNAFIRENAL